MCWQVPWLRCERVEVRGAGGLEVCELTVNRLFRAVDGRNDLARSMVLHGCQTSRGLFIYCVFSGTNTPPQMSEQASYCSITMHRGRPTFLCLNITFYT